MFFLGGERWLTKKVKATFSGGPRASPVATFSFFSRVHLFISLYLNTMILTDIAKTTTPKKSAPPVEAQPGDEHSSEARAITSMIDASHISDTAEFAAKSYVAISKRLERFQGCNIVDGNFPYRSANQ